MEKNSEKQLVEKELSLLIEFTMELEKELDSIVQERQ